MYQEPPLVSDSCYQTGLSTLFVTVTLQCENMQVNLKTRRVRTLAGNGRQGRDYQGGGSGRSQQLSSPWDVAFDRQVGVCML